MNALEELEHKQRIWKARGEFYIQIDSMTGEHVNVDMSMLDDNRLQQCVRILEAREYNLKHRPQTHHIKKYDRDSRLNDKIEQNIELLKKGIRVRL
jgi:hypothetical protein